jgi:NAD(P)-dependent dehydrogenase (short-subunit alcohol dehydrogenase family)
VELAGRRALVTGANRGLGEQFVEALLARGVDRVYAGARWRVTHSIRSEVPSSLLSAPRMPSGPVTAPPGG